MTKKNLNSSVLFILIAIFIYQNTPIVSPMKQILFLLSVIFIYQISKAQTDFTCLNQSNIVKTFTAPVLVNNIFPGDFNNDGSTDVVYSYQNSLRVLLANTGGSYTPVSTLTTVYSIADPITSADYNKDGNLDLALSYSNYSQIDVLLGNGNGTFATSQMYYPTYNVRSMVSVDVNNDGNVDIVSALSSGSVHVMYGSSTGSFVSVASTYVGGITEIVSEDFNNDGRKDIAAINLGSNSVSILLAQATGTLSAPVNYTVGVYPMGLSSSDFNNDGIKDIVTSNRDSDDISVLLGTSGGAFLPSVNYNVGYNSTMLDVVAKDFNNDLKQDIVAMDYTTGNIFIFYGNGTGTFNTKSSISLNAPIAMLSSDMNNDGKPDLLFRYNASAEFSVLYGSNSIFNLPYSLLFSGPGHNTDMLSVDYDLDSNLDLVMLSSNNISLLKGNGLGGFTSAASYSTDIGSANIISVDLNNDGFLDFAVANGSANNVSVLFGNNAGTFSQAVNYGTGGTAPYSLAAGDFNSDNVLDIAVANYSSNNIRYLMGNSGGTFALSANINWWSGVNPLSLVSKDLNNDGKMDLFFAGDNSGSADAGILFGDGAGNFSLGSITNSNTYNKSVISEDFDHNGSEDIVCASATKVNVLNTSYSVKSGKVRAVDLNHDGNLDIVSAAINLDNLIVLFGNGTGGFTNITNLWGGNSPNTFVSGDFNNDGSQDLIANNYGSASITVLLNAIPSLTITGADSLCRGNSANLIVTGAITYSWSSGSLSNIAIVSPTVGTTYTVTGTNQLGCSNTKKKYIKVNVLPLPSVGANTGTICEGESFAFVPSGAVTYSFSGGASIVSPTITTTYTITGFAANGCSDTAMKTINVNVAPIISVNSGAICTGESYTIVPSGANTYTITGGTDIVSPSSNMSYSVTGTDVNGCVTISPAISNVTVNALPTLTVNSGAICNGQSFTITPNGSSTYTYSGGSDIVSPLTDMSYSITGTDINGCISSIPAVSNVTVNALPVITVNDGIICNGQSFTITPSGASTYTFSGGTDIVNPTVNMSYSVTGTDVNGCESLTAAVSNVTVNSLPGVTASSSNTLLCVGETVTLTATGSTTYTWSTLENTSVIVVSPTVNTVYSVSTIDANNCSNMALVTLSVSVCTDINTNTLGNVGLLISPNPTNGILNISFNAIPQNTKIELYNSIGALVFTETMSNKNNIINVSELSSGMYFMKVLEGNKVVAVKKMVKE
jgi:hypothetical protein